MFTWKNECMLTGIRLKERSKQFSKKLQGLAHPIRLSIVYMLAFKDFQLYEISENLDYPPNLISHHIKTLQRSGWVVKKKWKQYAYYHLKTRILFDWYRLFIDTPLQKDIISKKLH